MIRRDPGRSLMTGANGGSVIDQHWKLRPNQAIYPAMQHVSQKARHGHLIHFYQELPPERRPQDSTGDGAGWTFELLEHGGDYPEAMPQANRATDAQGRSCVYVPIKEDGRVVDSCGFKRVKSENG